MTHVYFEQQAVKVNNIYCIGRNYVEHIAELHNETPRHYVALAQNKSSIKVGRKLPTFYSSV